MSRMTSTQTRIIFISINIIHVVHIRTSREAFIKSEAGIEGRTTHTAS